MIILILMMVSGVFAEVSINSQFEVVEGSVYSSTIGYNNESFELECDSLDSIYCSNGYFWFSRVFDKIHISMNYRYSNIQIEGLDTVYCEVIDTIHLLMKSDTISFVMHLVKNYPTSIKYTPKTRNYIENKVGYDLLGRKSIQKRMVLTSRKINF